MTEVQVKHASRPILGREVLVDGVLVGYMKRSVGRSPHSTYYIDLDGRLVASGHQRAIVSWLKGEPKRAFDHLYIEGTADAELGITDE